MQGNAFANEKKYNRSWPCHHSGMIRVLATSAIGGNISIRVPLS